MSMFGHYKRNFDAYGDTDDAFMVSFTGITNKQVLNIFHTT